MLFEINDNEFNDIAFEYFNIPLSSYKPESDIMEPSSGLVCGNMFKNEYSQYKEYIPKRITGGNDREKLLLKIQELDFAINDLSLKLDINPNDYSLYKLFREYAIELKKLCEEYSRKYEVLELINDTNGNYTWLNDPWPWEGGKKYV